MTAAPTLYGRERELAAWKEAERALAGGKGGVLTFSGSPGLGKTALVQTVVGDATANEWPVIQALNDEVSHNLPGNVLWQFFARLVQNEPAGSAPFDGPGGLVHRYVRQEEENVDAAALSFSTAWILRSLAEKNPLVVVIDDAQWADELSLDVISATLSLVSDEAILFVLGVRTSPAEEPNVKVDALLSRSGTRQVALSPLRYEDIAGWTAGETGSATRETVSRIQIASAGVPYFVSELIATIGPEDRDVDGREVGDRSAQEILASRVARLDTADREILSAIALLGEHAIDEYVVGLTGHDAATLENSYATLRSQRLLARDLPLRVTHSLVAAAVRSLAGPESVSKLNQRISEVIDDSNPGTVAAFLAETSPGDNPAVARLLLKGGNQALSLGSPEIASRFFERGLREGGVEPGLRAQLTTSFGQALLKSGDASGAIAKWSSALEMDLDELHEIECLLGMGDAHYAVGDLDQATRRFGQALETAEAAGDLPPGTTSRIVARLASTGVLNQTGLADPGRHIAAVREASSEGDTIDDRTLLVQEALRLTLIGEPAEQTGPLARRALAGNTLLEEVSVEGPVLPMAIATLIYSERDDESMRILEESMAHARRRGSVIGHAMLSSCRGFLNFFRGRLRMAQAEHEAALEATGMGLNPYFDASVDQLCQIRIARGDLEGAARLIDLVPLAEGLPDVILALRHHVHGLLLRVRGDRDGALAHFKSAAEHTEGYGGQMLKAWDRSAIDTAMELGQVEYARSLAGDLLEVSRRVGAPRFLGFTLRTVAHTQDFGPAVATLRESIGLLTAAEGKYELALAMADLSRLLITHSGEEPGRLEEGRELARRAMGISEQIGAVTLRESLIEAAAPAESDGTARESLADRLTVSELKVCQLAIRGMTNRQIADHLFITVKGVEWHLSRSYRKLDISSRRELGDSLGDIDELIT